MLPKFADFAPRARLSLAIGVVLLKSDFDLRWAAVIAAPTAEAVVLNLDFFLRLVLALGIRGAERSYAWRFVNRAITCEA